MNEGLKVLMVHAYFRDDQPGGIATGMMFDGDDGIDFCRKMEGHLFEYDTHTLDDVVANLARRSPRRHVLTQREVRHVIMCVHWMQVRRHLVADEYNGTMFVCEYQGTIIPSEINPVTLDMSKVMTSKAAVDVTDILVAGQTTLDGGAEALRATMDHTRGRR